MKALLVLLFVSVASLFSPAQTVSFFDPALEDVVRVRLAKPTGTLTTNDLLSLTTLSASHRGITNLAGLEAALNLTELNLGFNHLVEVSPLAGLTSLTQLNIGYNPLIDGAGLDTLTNLTALWADGTLFTNVYWLENMKALTSLYLGTKVRDYSPLANLSRLEVLYAGGPNLTNCNWLSGLTNLYYLDLRRSGLKDVSCLAGLHRLEQLLLFENKIRDPSPLAALTNLHSLNLSVNPLYNCDGLSQLTHLDYLDLQYSQITNASGLGGLTLLEQLLLEGNNINDFAPLSGLTNLHVLYAGANPLSECAWVTNLASLTTLSLPSTSITNLPPLSSLRLFEFLDLTHSRVENFLPLTGLTNLNALWLGDNPGTNYAVLAQLGNLQTLQLNGSRLHDLSFLQNAIKLRYFSATQNEIRDLNPLASLTNLYSLDLSWNTLQDISPLTNLPALHSLDLYGNLLDLTPGSPASETIAQLQNRGVVIGYLPQNGPPFLYASTPWVIAQNTTSSLQFSVSDDSTPASNITTVAFSSNDLVLPDSAMHITGTDTYRTLTLTPAMNQTGQVVVTIVATDGFGLASTFPVEIHVEWATNVNITDPILLQAVRSWVGAYDRPLTSLDLKDLTYLSAWNVTNLSGLEWAVNLNELRLQNSPIQDFSPLRGLTNLHIFGLESSGVTNCSGLGDLTSLTQLDLSYTLLQDIDCLAGLTNLTSLYMVNTRLTDPSPLGGLTNLQQLFLSGNPLGDAPGLAALSNLTGILYLDSCGITNGSNLSGLTHLTGLSLASAPLKDVAPLGALTNLVWLDLSSTRLTNWASLAVLTNLPQLHLYDNGITNLSQLPPLPNLSLLLISRNALTTLDGIGVFANLQTLYAPYNHLTNVQALAELPRLDYADVRINLLDITPGSVPMNLIDSLIAGGVTVEYTPQNLPPRFESVSPIAIPAGETSDLQFFLADDATFPSNLVCAVHSLNPVLLPDENVRLSLSRRMPPRPPGQFPNPYPYASAWSLSLTPVPGQVGSATLVLTGTDDTGLVSTTNITLTVLMPQTIDAGLSGDTNLSWTTFGTVPWSPAADSHDGNGAVVSGSSESWLRASVTGPGTLTYWWKPLAPSNSWASGLFTARNSTGLNGSAWTYDWLGWKKETLRFSPGTWILQWQPNGSAPLLLDEVSFSPGIPDARLQLGYAGGAYGQSLAIEAEIGACYDLMVSSDLQHWSRLDTITQYDFTTFYSEAFAAPVRFYRLLRVGVAPVLWLGPPYVDQGGTLHLELHGRPGAEADLESSEDLVHWITEAAYFIGPGSTSVVRSNATPVRFYRLKQRLLDGE